MIQTSNIKAVTNVNAFVIAVVSDPKQFVLATVGRAGH